MWGTINTDELKTPPDFWVGPELTARIVRGICAFLTRKQLREANSRDGLNLVCWENCFLPEYEDKGEVQRYMMTGFIESTRGYLWKRSDQPAVLETGTP